MAVVLLQLVDYFVAKLKNQLQVRKNTCYTYASRAFQRSVFKLKHSL